MAVVYYPTGQKLYSKDTSQGNYTALVLASSPDVVLYFGTASTVSSASALDLPITCSWARSASVSITFEFVTSASWASSSYTASYLLNYAPTISASWASQSLSASYAPGGVSSAYVTLATSSVASPGITCSFLDTKEYVTFNTGSVTYTFTSSNPPATDVYATTTCYINNTITGGNTASLAFPAAWTFLGYKPTFITTSKHAELTMEAFGSTIVAAWAPQY